MEVSLSTLLTMYVIMLGPVKLILPFAHVTANADKQMKFSLATRATSLAGGVAIICLLLGDWVVGKFLLSSGTLLIAIAIFLMVFAYDLAHKGDPSRGSVPPPPEEPTKSLATIPLAFPGIIPPQGFGLLVLSTQVSYLDAPLQGLPLLVALTLTVMVINFVCMIGADGILRVTGKVFWLVVVRFLSPVFVALSVHLFLKGLRQAGII